MEKAYTEYEARFSYGKDGLITKQFIIHEGESIHEAINKYLKEQNSGEPPSDRIKFVSKTIKKIIA